MFESGLSSNYQLPYLFVRSTVNGPILSKSKRFAKRCSSDRSSDGFRLRVLVIIVVVSDIVLQYHMI